MFVKKTVNILLLLLLPSFLIAQQKLDGIAAIVGDEIILYSELNQFAAQLAIQNKIDLQKDPQKFEELKKIARENLIVQKILLAKAIEDTITADDARVEEMLDGQIKQWVQQLGSEKKIEEYFGMPISKIKRQFRDEVKNRLMVETLQGQYVRKITITRPEVEQFYRTMKDSLPEMQEMVHIKHILREIRAGGSGREEALKKAKEIHQKLLDGADFAAMAKQYSEDPGSAKKGGELGLIKRGDFVKEFEEAAFKLKKGEISDIVETKFGFHIIEVIERRGERINVRHILIRLQPTSADAEHTAEFLSVIRDSIILGADFGEMAKKYSDDATSADNGGDLGWFEINQLQVKEFKTALQNMQVGDISKPFRTDFGYHIILLADKREKGKLTLEKDWQQIEQMALARKQGKEMQAWIDKLRKDVYVEIKE